MRGRRGDRRNHVDKVEEGLDLGRNGGSLAIVHPSLDGLVEFFLIAPQAVLLRSLLEQGELFLGQLLQLGLPRRHGPGDADDRLVFAAYLMRWTILSHFGFSFFPSTSFWAVSLGFWLP